MIDSLTVSPNPYTNLVSQRHKVVASGIANADTLVTKTQDLDSRASFRSAPDSSSPEAQRVTRLQTKNYGNNVDFDREARLLAENTMRFSVTSHPMHSTISRVKEAIQEGTSL